MSDRAVNEYVRQRLRELRSKKSIGIREITESTGIPASSYCCMEGGYYNISLDNLFRILGVLGADISDVWPAETAGAEASTTPTQLRRIQEFRVSEIVNLSGAEGAALFSVEGTKCEVLLHEKVSDFLLDRLCLYLEDDRTYDQGLWFRKKLGDVSYVFFLKGKSCPEYLRRLIDQYLVIWSNLFGQVLE
jgi:transcriptional regulator with XRE-family HTH domain